MPKVLNLSPAYNQLSVDHCETSKAVCSLTAGRLVSDVAGGVQQDPAGGQHQEVFFDTQQERKRTPSSSDERNSILPAKKHLGEII